MDLKKWSCGALMAFGLALGQSASATEILIELSGIDLVYADETLCDATSCNGGSGDSADADALASVDVWIDGILTSQLNAGDGIYLDFGLGDLAGIVAGANGIYSATGGIFDLITDSNGSLLTDFPASVDVVWISATDEIKFTFLASVNSIFSDTFNLAPIDPNQLIEISLSANVMSFLTDDMGIVTEFAASGTGEMYQEVPEPWALSIMGLGLLALGLRRRRG